MGKKIFFSLLLFGLPFFSYGTELKFTTILETSDNQALLRFGGLATSSVYLCQLDDLSCQNLGSTTPPKIAEIFSDSDSTNGKIKNIKFNRNVASRRTLSPDGKWFAYYESSKTNKERVRKFNLLDLRSAKKNQTYTYGNQVKYWDLLTEDLRIFDFSPAGKKLLYLDDSSGYHSLYLVDLTKPQKNYLPGQQLFSNKYTISDFMFWDENSIYFAGNSDSSHSWSVYNYNLATKKINKIADNFSYSQKMRRWGNNLLFLQIINNSSVPALYSPTTGKISYFPALTSSKTETGYSEKEITLGKLQGVIIKPSNFSPTKTYPLIIWLHGGPYRQTSLGYHSASAYAVYDWLINQMAKNGALVLKLDYRGSYGYGRKFAESIKGEIGRGDVADVLTALKELKKNYNINQAYLVGNSYGGYLSLKSIVENPKLFAGAFSINGVTSWEILLEKLTNSIFNDSFDGLLSAKNSQLYYQADIDDRVKNLGSQKIVIAQASEDNTIFPDQADHLKKVFDLKNKPIKLIKYPGENHVLKKPDTMEDLCRNLASMINITANCKWNN